MPPHSLAGGVLGVVIDRVRVTDGAGEHHDVPRLDRKVACCQ